MSSFFDSDNAPSLVLSQVQVLAANLAPLNGMGAPDPALGLIGNRYYDVTDPNAPVLYGPKTSSGWGAGVPLVGPPGTSDNTYTTYAELLASDPARKSARLVPAVGEIEAAGNFNYIGGAWVRQTGAGITRKRPGTTTLLRSADNVENEKHANAFDYIPAANHNAIMARTSTYDCTADLQKLVDENQRWLLPRGRFYVSGAGFSPPTDSYGSGAGRGASTIKKTTSQDAQCIRLLSASNVTLEDFDMDGSRGSQTSTYDEYKFCLYATGGEGLVMRRLGAKGATTDNITIELTKNTLGEDIASKDCNKQAFYASSCDGLVLNGLSGSRNGSTGGQTGAGSPQIVGSLLAIACTWDVSVSRLYSAANKHCDVIFGRGSKNLKFDSTCVFGDNYNGRSEVAAVIGIGEAISGTVHGQTYNGQFYGTESVQFLGCVINGRMILELVDDLLIDSGILFADPALGSGINLLGCQKARISNEIRNWNLAAIATFNSSKNGGRICSDILADSVRFLSPNGSSTTRLSDASGVATNFREADSRFNGSLVEATSSRANKASANVGAASQTGSTTPSGVEFNAFVDKFNLAMNRLANGIT